MHRFALVCLGLLMFAPAARAEGTLGEALKGMALDIKKFLDGRDEKAITLGAFRGTQGLSLHSSAGPLLVKGLQQFLSEMKIEIKRKANITLLGEYFEAEDSKKGTQVVVLELELRDGTGMSYRLGSKIEGKSRSYDYVVKEQSMVALLVGVTTYIPPDTPKKERNDHLKKQIDNPQPSIVGSYVKADKGPFAIEILLADAALEKRTAADYKPHRPTNKEGLAFVPILRNQVYAVKLVNDSDYEVAVDLRIDGLNMFIFSDARDPKTGGPKYRYVVLPPKSYGLVRGWCVTDNDSDEFVVTEYAKSAAAQFPSAANVGTISASFFRAWDKDTPRPRDEPVNADEFSLSADATGRGQRFEETYRAVEYTVGVLRGTISVRYSK